VFLTSIFLRKILAYKPATILIHQRWHSLEKRKTEYEKNNNFSIYRIIN
jgi:hypothetical protein